jgi:hypothetical protein
MTEQTANTIRAALTDYKFPPEWIEGAIADAGRVPLAGDGSDDDVRRVVSAVVASIQVQLAAMRKRTEEIEEENEQTKQRYEAKQRRLAELDAEIARVEAEYTIAEFMGVKTTVH